MRTSKHFELQVCQLVVLKINHAYDFVETSDFVLFTACPQNHYTNLKSTLGQPLVTHYKTDLKHAGTMMSHE